MTWWGVAWWKFLPFIVSFFILLLQGSATAYTWMRTTNRWPFRLRTLGLLRLTVKDGPMVPVTLTSVGGSVCCWLVVDTGASHTIVDENLLKTVKAPIYSTVQINNGGAIIRECVNYVVDLKFPGMPEAGVITGLPVTGDVEKYPIPGSGQGVLGRDVLQYAELNITGNWVHMKARLPGAVAQK